MTKKVIKNKSKIKNKMVRKNPSKIQKRIKNPKHAIKKQIINFYYNAIMPATKSQLTEMLHKNGLSIENGYEISIKALVADGDHWQINISSAHFNGISKIAQHRKVIDALENLATDVHAISIKTFAK